MTSEPSTSDRRRRIVGVVVGFAVSGFFVWLLLRGLDLSELVGEIAAVSVGILAVSLITDLLSVLCMTARSHLLLNSIGRYSFGETFKSVLLVYAGNTLFPLRAGELLRVGFLARVGEVSNRSCLAIVGFERLLDALCVMVLFLATLSFTLVDVGLGVSLWVTAGLLVSVVGGVVWVSRDPGPIRGLLEKIASPFGGRVEEWGLGTYDQFVEGLTSLSSFRKTVWVVVATVGNWIFVATSLGIILIAFDLHLPWYAPFIILGFLTLGNLLPSSPGNVGTHEYFATAALTLLGVAKVKAASYAVVQHAVGTLPLTLLAVVFFFPEVRRGVGLVFGRDE